MGFRAPIACTLLCLGLAVGCGDDSGFQSLSSLCEDLADDICTARNQGCCAAVDPMTCLRVETERCDAVLTPIKAEPTLRYDAAQAARTREAARAQLDQCGPPPRVSSFFIGVLNDGAACERDAQCSGGLCTADTRVCAQAPAPPLCSVP